MTAAITADLTIAHDEVVAIVKAIPDAALGWQPSSDDWSLKQIIGHLAHANDFYVMIVDEARASDFGVVRLHRELPGVQRMTATDIEVARRITLLAVLHCFEQTYQRMLAVLQSITPEELDRPFVLYSFQPDAESLTTTLRQRVIQRAASHIREHQTQLSNTLARWRATHVA